MSIQLPLYRGQTGTLAELLALGPAAEGVGFNMQGDGDPRYTDNQQPCYWRIRNGAPVWSVSVGVRSWTRRPDQPIRIIVPHDGPWNPAEEAFPPPGTRVLLTTISSYGPYATGLVICHVGQSTGYNWRLVWSDNSVDSDQEPVFEFHPHGPQAHRHRLEHVYAYQQTDYEIVSHPETRYVAPTEDNLPPVSAAAPGCPVCNRTDVFWDERAGRFTATYRPGLTMGNHRRRRNRGAEFCDGTKYLKAVRNMFHCFAECPRCFVVTWRTNIQHGCCSDCRSRRGTIQRVGAQPNQLRFGAELETEGISYSRQAGDIANRKKGWKAKSDGSLRGNHAEVTTPPTTFNEQGIATFMETVRELRRAGARATHRCGGHVHVGLEDLTYAQIGSVVEWYWLMEPAVYSALPPWSVRATYCQPMREDMRHAAKEAVQLQSRERMGNLPCDRYRGLNSCSFNKYGTFEFRFFNGTIHAVRATANVALVVHLVSHASRNVLMPGQTEIPRFPATREGMLAVLDKLEIKDPAWRWHLLGQHQTEEDRPHGPRPDLAEKMEKKRNLPPTPRRVRNYGMVLTASEAVNLGLTRCLILESTYPGDRIRNGDLRTRVQFAVERVEDHQSSGYRLDQHTIDVNTARNNSDMLVAVPFRNWDVAIQQRETQRAQEAANAP